MNEKTVEAMGVTDWTEGQRALYDALALLCSEGHATVKLVRPILNTVWVELEMQGWVVFDGDVDFGDGEES